MKYKVKAQFSVSARHEYVLDGIEVEIPDNTAQDQVDRIIKLEVGDLWAREKIDPVAIGMEYSGPDYDCYYDGEVDEVEYVPIIEKEKPPFVDPNQLSLLGDANGQNIIRPSQE
jgi:hypothetical protein